MTFFSNIRISHKLSALMVGLVGGFVLIGVAYYVQISVDNRDREQALSVADINAELLDASLNTQQLALLYSQADLFDLEQQRLRAQPLLSSLSVTVESLQYRLEQQALSRAVTGQPLLQEDKVETLNKAWLKLQEAFNVSQQSLLGETKESTGSTTRMNSSEYTGMVERQFSADLVTAAITYFNRQLVEVALPFSEWHARGGVVSGSIESLTTINVVFIGLLFGVAMAAALGMYFIYKSIVFPMAHIQRVIRRINRGDVRIRVGLKTQDELGDLGRAFNQLLDERINALQQQSHENDKLNNSIISLIKSLGRIAKRDLTVKVPVSDDITGTVSDAVNLLAQETAKTLHQVKGVSEQVYDVSERLQNQSEGVVKVAESEREQVIETARALEISAKAMNAIAGEAESANSLAARTMDATHEALTTVTETVSGIRDIRETISETEKRIKRLGERSQEITGIVNLINTIAERTHILALNASMHAASAGEAGKGFAVVAEEVQRLAENAREATANISDMVNNIRVETSDTVSTMNKLISQVAAGSKMAEKAGSSMEETEASTKELVETVRLISEGAINQAKFAGKVRDRATTIRKYTEQTGKKLEEQTLHTNELKAFSHTLLERVNMFSLPAHDAARVDTYSNSSAADEPVKNLINDQAGEGVDKVIVSLKPARESGVAVTAPQVH
jgi:twitching motility protein PilJ